MRATAWAIGGVGTTIGLVIIASVMVAGATMPGFSGEDGLGPDLRATLVGVVVIATSLAIASSVRRSHRWAHHVFLLLAVLGLAAGAWWAISDLLG